MKRWEETFERLDRISRTRALTDSESMLLEYAIKEIDGATPEGLKRKNSWTPADEALLRELIAGGMAIRRAGEHLGKTGSATVGKWRRMTGRSA